MSLSGNKGEWSEIYTLFKILGDGFITTEETNKYLLENKVQEIIYPIIKILREESNGSIEYLIDKEIVLVSLEQNEILRIPMERFREFSVLLLQKIKAGEKTFNIPEIDKFLFAINCLSLKAKSSKKTDITMVIHDIKTNQTPILGFSIKSQIGGASTLFNASQSTNFKYKVCPQLSSQQIEEVNAINTKVGKIRNRVLKILEYQSNLIFQEIEHTTFCNNLTLIDSRLPEILAQIILMYYSTGISKLQDLLDQIEKLNPLQYNQSENHKFYSYKIKRFLIDIALGMMASKVWDGNYDSTGGYLVVKEDGNISCYHLYNRKLFEDYLLRNTKIDTPSSTRHKFGNLYQQNKELFINLNFQIRFLC